MTEPAPTWNATSAAANTEASAAITPTYADILHFAAVGRALTIMAGYALDQRPPAAIVLMALRRQGLLTERGNPR